MKVLLTESHQRYVTVTAAIQNGIAETGWCDGWQEASSGIGHRKAASAAAVDYSRVPRSSYLLFAVATDAGAEPCYPNVKEQGASAERTLQDDSVHRECSFLTRF